MSPGPKYLSGDKAAIAEFIDRFDVFLLDCDGVIWSGDHLFEGVPETIHTLQMAGIKVRPERALWTRRKLTIISRSGF